MALQEDRARLMAHFAGDESKHHNKWSDLWDKGNFLPWDRGAPNPALEDALTERKDLLGSRFTEDALGRTRRKRAFVPGCGKGYDVLLFASFGYDAYGLEVSETAVKRCIEEQKTHGHKYPVRDEAVGAGKVTFMRGDFFSPDWMINVEGDGKLDLIYDYTVDVSSVEHVHIQGTESLHVKMYMANHRILVPVCSSTQLPSRMGASYVAIVGFRRQPYLH